MSTTETLQCACDHCHCPVAPSEGYVHDGLVYCGPACATHDHEHPDACCVAHACCT